MKAQRNWPSEGAFFANTVIVRQIYSKSTIRMAMGVFLVGTKMFVHTGELGPQARQGLVLGEKEGGGGEMHNMELQEMNLSVLELLA